MTKKSNNKRTRKSRRKIQKGGDIKQYSIEGILPITTVAAACTINVFTTP